MVYSTVVDAGLILPKKKKYTKRDCELAILDSLFNPYQGRTLTKKEACFVVKCSAVFHGTEWSKGVATFAD